MVVHLRKLKRVAVVPDYCGIGQGPMLPRAKFTGMDGGQISVTYLFDHYNFVEK